MTKKLTYEYVKNYISGSNCTLLSKEYINQYHLLEIKFSCGHIENRMFNKFKYGKNICSKCAGVRKYTLKEAQDIVNSNGYLYIDDIYINCKSDIYLEDNLGYKYKTSLDKFINNVVDRGSLLSKFDIQNPYTIDNVCLYLVLNNSNLSLDYGQVWYGNNFKMNFTDKDGYKYSSSFDCIIIAVRNGTTPSKFDISNTFTIHNIENWIKLNNKSYYLLEGQKYIGKESKLKFKCLKCPSEEKPFETIFSSLLSKNGGCNYCNSTFVGNCNSLEYKFPDIAKEFDINKNYPIIPKDIAAHSGKKFYWICPDCLTSYFSSVSKRTGNEARGCPVCNESNLEKRARKTLEKYNISFIPQKRFDDCRDQLALPFDFYLIDYNVVCECQGIQHTMSVDHFGGEEGFIIRKKHDKIKKDYCIKNNIPLIEIPYWDFKNIEQILTKELNLQ
jgi:hypothetical protein